MATGLIGSSNGNHIFRLLEGISATNSPPSGSSAGLAIPSMSNAAAQIWPLPSSVVLALYTTAGSGTASVTARLWGYLPVAGVWVPAGTGADGTKGTINAGAAIGETGSDTIRHSEIIAGLFTFDRLYVELTAVTTATVNVDLLIGPAGRD